MEMFIDDDDGGGGGGEDTEVVAEVLTVVVLLLSTIDWVISTSVVLDAWRAEVSESNIKSESSVGFKFKLNNSLASKLFRSV